MLLIACYGKIFSFYKLFMPKLLGQSKHKEFESNSALHITDQKERRAENAKKLELQEIFRSLRNFCRLHCSSCKISFMSMFILQYYSCLLHTVHFSPTVPAACLKFCIFVPLLISSHFVLVIVTPPILVRPDWRIRTGFGVRNHILGLLIIIIIFFRADLICGIQIIFVITNNRLHLKMNYHQSGIH